MTLHQKVIATCRTRHLSTRTTRTYWTWIKRFVNFHDLQHPAKLNAGSVNEFLSYLASERNVAASTQDQAKNAIVFLYRDVLDIRLGNFGDIVKAKRPRRLPVVLSPGEVLTILALLDVVPRLACSLLYGGGLRVDECISLRIKDLDFQNRTLHVRRGKGAKDRITVIPQSNVAELRDQIAVACAVHNRDLRDGFGEAELPSALAVKYPRMGYEFG